MQSTASIRKAGEGGACAVLIGVGDGALLREVVPLYLRVVAICFPGETPAPDPLPRNVAQFIVRSPADAEQIVSMVFSQHASIAGLEATDFYTGHCTIQDEELRKAFARQFYEVLAQRPASQGNDIIDGLQGAYHIALNAHLLMGAPTPDELPKLSCPVISVCPGPSLAKHLDALRKLQFHCLIIAADTALDGLLKAGITPHMVTPVERTPVIADEAFTAESYPGIVFAGSPVVHQYIAPKFEKHILIPGSDTLFTWMGCDVKQLFFYGQSTGVCSATLGTRLSTGPVYLVGHDLAFNDTQSHWGAVHKGVQLGNDVKRIPVKANNGETLDSQFWWIFFAMELANLAMETGRIHNVNGHTKDGAFIAHTIPSPLPDPATLPPFELPQWPEPRMDRIAHISKLLKRLPNDVQAVLLHLSSSQITINDIDYRKLCPSQNSEMLGYITRSILNQFGMQHLNGQSAHIAANDCAYAIRNALGALMPIFKTMSEAPVTKMEIPCK